jgi:hypothetical protein
MRVPRFNMPFELGLNIGITSNSRHQWHIMEAVRFRLGHSLSDLGGYDAVIVHGNRIKGVFEGLLEMFASRRNAAIDDVAGMMRVYRVLRDFRRTLPADIYQHRCFKQLVIVALYCVKPASLPPGLRTALARRIGPT